MDCEAGLSIDGDRAHIGNLSQTQLSELRL
jgi:hypothetical protein